MIRALAWSVRAALVVGAVLAVSAPGAAAAEYTVLQCDRAMDGAPTADLGWWPYNIGGNRVENRCPDHLTLNEGSDQAGDADLDDSFSFFRYDYSHGPIKRISMMVQGGDMSGRRTYALRDCPDCLPAPDRYFTGTEPGEPPKEVTFDFAESPQWPTLIVICEDGPCPHAPELRINSIRLLTEDETPPNGNIDAEPFGAVHPDGTIWVQSDQVDIRVWASDHLSGVRHAALSSGSTLLWEAHGDCDDGVGPNQEFPRFAICGSDGPGQLGRFGTFPRGVLEEGRVPLTFTAEDAFGNAAEPVVTRVLVDDTAPDPPTEVHLNSSVSESGWVTEPEIELGWTLAPVEYTGIEVAPRYRKRFDVDPLLPGQPDPKAFELSYWWPDEISRILPGEGRWRVHVQIGDTAGNWSESTFIDVGFDRDAPAPPRPTDPGWISLQALEAGFEFDWLAPDIEPGESPVCGYDFAASGSPAADFSQAERLAPDATSVVVPASIGDGKHYLHLRAVGCNDLFSSAVTAALNVDGEVPNAKVYGLPTGDWSAQPVELTIAASDAESGVAEITYSIDGGSPVVTDSAVAKFIVPAGFHTVEYSVVDRAGNSHIADPVTLGSDTTPPDVAFEAWNPSDPTRVTASVTDADSKVASVWIELRRIDSAALPSEQAWRQVGAVENGAAAPVVSFSRFLPDAEMLAGLWQIRIVAFDVAGNAAAGGELTLSAPLRGQSKVTAALAKVVRTCRTKSGKSCPARCKRGCVNSTRVDRRSASVERRSRFGERLALVGRLTDQKGDAVASAQITILAEQRNKPKATIGTALTNANGEWEYIVPNGPTRIFTANYGGNAILRPASANARANVRAAVTFAVSRTSVRVGQTIKFTGRLSSGSLDLPAGGKLVSIQFLRAGRWVPTIDIPRTDSRGRFSARYKFLKQSKPATFYFLARVIAEGDWPFEVGSSKKIAVRVRP